MSIHVEISPGELIDRITILEIKAERIGDDARRRHVEHELAISSAARNEAMLLDERMTRMETGLKGVNAELWEVEDALRDCERVGDFGPRFVTLARSVYHLNDKRAAIKREINRLLDSPLVEEKSYQPY